MKKIHKMILKISKLIQSKKKVWTKNLKLPNFARNIKSKKYFFQIFFFFDKIFYFFCFFAFNGIFEGFSILHETKLLNDFFWFSLFKNRITWLKKKHISKTKKDTLVIFF